MEARPHRRHATPKRLLYAETNLFAPANDPLAPSKTEYSPRLMRQQAIVDPIADRLAPPSVQSMNGVVGNFEFEDLQRFLERLDQNIGEFIALFSRNIRLTTSSCVSRKRSTSFDISLSPLIPEPSRLQRGS